ncbi:MAG: hypothetical protein RIC52_18855, partial [Amphiplicatus sp.]
CDAFLYRDQAPKLVNEPAFAHIGGALYLGLKQPEDFGESVVLGALEPGGRQSPGEMPGEIRENDASRCARSYLSRIKVYVHAALFRFLRDQHGVDDPGGLHG